MRSDIATAAVLIGVFAVVSTPLYAQWPLHATAGVPRTADGEPDLQGPVPRMADGKPDLSGIWARINHRGTETGAQGHPAGEPDQPPPGAPPYANFWDIGFGLEDGLPFRPWARELRDQRMADASKDNPDAYCLPIGHMLFHLHPQPRKIIQTPDVIVILYESNGGIRQILTDGRPSPGNDALPWWYGYSVGTWEGDTLVVETTQLRDGMWLDYDGSPLTEAGKITERFRRVNYGQLEIDVTIEDTTAYTAPFTVRVEQEIMLDTSLIEFVCNENEKSTRYFDR